MIDILAVCAHPDDLEVCAGGIFAKAKKEGWTTGLVIMTSGESGGYAEQSTREEEAKQAASILGLDYFEMLCFPDAGLEFRRDAVEALIPHLRACSPRYILTLHENDYHPDHVAVSRITRDACFTAGLKKYSTDGTDWHYDAIFYFSADRRTNKRRPDVYVDITDVMNVKEDACKAHHSQNILPFALEMAREYGASANCAYAEGLFLEQSITLDSITGLLRKKQ